jgi:hypothetical protein
MCEEGERLISLDDKSIMLIRLTLVKVDDHFNQEVPVTSTSAKQRTLNLRG